MPPEPVGSAPGGPAGLPAAPLGLGVFSGLLSGLRPARFQPRFRLPLRTSQDLRPLWVRPLQRNGFGLFWESCSRGTVDNK
jgi:hypothetical protein